MASSRRDDATAVGTGRRPGADPSRAGDAAIDPARWLDEHGDTLFRYAMLRLRDRNQAEEVVQECLLAAIAAKESFENRASERTWLISILKRKIVDVIRRAARERTTETNQGDVGSGSFDERGFWRIRPARWREDPSDAIQRAEFVQVLFDCVDKLPSGLADAIVLRELNQLDSDEVCDALAISPQNLWQRLHRARLALRRCLELNWFDASTSRSRDGS